jgi:hypothetical protein
MPASRIIIVLSAVVLVLFGISLALSSRTAGDYRAIPQAPWIEGLKNIFLKDQRLKTQDISSPCLGNVPNAFVVEPGKKCEAMIAESNQVVRMLKLTVKEGSKCMIDFVPSPGDNALPVHSTSGNVELSIMQKGGTLTITCTDAGTAKTALVYIK